MKTSINLEELKSLGPCDGGRAFKAVFGNKTVTFSEAAKAMNWEDIWWCISKLWDQLSKEQKDDIHLLGCQYAEDVLHLFEDEYPEDKRPRLAIKAKRKWIKGEIRDKELRKVRLAAETAARSAAGAATRTAWLAVGSAVGSAAWSARSAAGAAWSAELAELAAWIAAAAARSAGVVGAATRAEQKDMLINVFIKWEKRL